MTAVRLGPGSIDLEFHPAKPPPMLEVSPAHRVSCYLYTPGKGREGG
ncbi:MAG TPA: hypothetical protein VEY12_10415 [Thermoplasmata archaeon]|nr:hypothetical protein [Thermoplasmata archaeon]